MSEANQSKLQAVFREVFGDDEIEIRREMTAEDVEEWDSLMHVTLIVQVEEAFGLRFSALEVAGLEDVGALLDLIQTKQAAQG